MTGPVKRNAWRTPDDWAVPEKDRALWDQVAMRLFLARVDQEDASPDGIVGLVADGACEDARAFMYQRSRAWGEE